MTVPKKPTPLSNSSSCSNRSSHSNSNSNIPGFPARVLQPSLNARRNVIQERQLMMAGFKDKKSSVGMAHQWLPTILQRRCSAVLHATRWDFCQELPSTTWEHMSMPSRCSSVRSARTAALGHDVFDSIWARCMASRMPQHHCGVTSLCSMKLWGCCKT